MKFLIVDDHAGVRTLLRQLITPPALAIEECDCGADALRVAREFQPDLVLLDIRLPDINGLAVARTLRTDCPAARVVIITAHDEPHVRDAAKAIGVLSFLPKDSLFELPSLLGAWSEAVAGRKP